MRALAIIMLLSLAALFGAREQTVAPPAGGNEAADAPAGRFEAIDIYLDAGETPVAAYQLAIRDPASRIAIVGIEGGEHAAFAQPPYYDPKAMQQDHVILAAYSLAAPADLPSGKTRVATLHVHVSGDQPVQYQATLTTAAAADGTPIPASLQWQKGDAQ